jgi:hypothetical protein
LKQIVAIILEKTFFVAEPRLVLLEPELVGDADPALFPPLTTAEPYSCHGCRVCYDNIDINLRGNGDD